MGSNPSRCCDRPQGDTANEQMESAYKKEASPGAAALPTIIEPAEPAAVAQTRDIAPASIADDPPSPPPPPKSDTEYTVTLDRTSGDRLGVDVDNQDGKTLLIESINGGLVGKWNDANPNEKVKVMDRIIEVNGIRDDLLKLVDECRKNQVLKLKLLRG
mmetsp:Transcript_53360/g.93670  ORF Transcript_53360/g.93670 Transcript_53360/m.93670 type:complete len:159 (-) Transcript_53360:73-549(-)